MTAEKFRELGGPCAASSSLSVSVLMDTMIAYVSTARILRKIQEVLSPF